MSKWKTLASRTVYDNKFIRVLEDQVINPAGKETVYGMLETKNKSVYIVPVDEKNNTYIIQQYRYTIKKNTWECVAGWTDGEKIEIAAKRELLEETGLESNDIDVLGDIQIAIGVADIKGTVCLARGLTKMSDKLDEVDGILSIKKLPLSELRSKILLGEISCSQSIAAFLMAIAYLEDGK